MSCNYCSKNCSAKTTQPQRRWWQWFSHKNHNIADPLSNKATVALVGSPNVGKSVLFNALTSHYVTVSNYPGTTVDISTGKMTVGEQAIAILDTPGMYSLLPITEEEKVGRDLLMTTDLDVVIHVVDAKHLGRMLNFTLQLLEAGLPVLLAVNLIDEADHLGIKINDQDLQDKLGIPVVLMAAAHNIGVQELKTKVLDYVESCRLSSTHRNSHQPDQVSIIKR